MALALATNLQKPRPERCPITDPSLPPCATACCQPLRNAASKRPTAHCRPQAGRPRVASFLRRSPRRVDQARLPQSKALGSNRRSCATPSVELAAALASTRARRSLKQPSAPRRPLQAEQLRARGPLARPKRARPSLAQRSFGSSQRSRNFHAANASATQLAPAAALG